MPSVAEITAEILRRHDESAAGNKLGIHSLNSSEAASAGSTNRRDTLDPLGPELNWAATRDQDGNLPTSLSPTPAQSPIPSMTSRSEDGNGRSTPSSPPPPQSPIPSMASSGDEFINSPASGPSHPQPDDTRPPPPAPLPTPCITDYDEPTQMHYDQAVAQLVYMSQPGGVLFYHPERREGVPFKDLDPGSMVVWLSRMTRGHSTDERMIRDMPRGRWPNARVREALIERGGEMDMRELGQLGGGKVEDAAGMGMAGLVKGPATSTGEDGKPSSEVDDDEVEEQRFRRVHLFPGFNTPPYPPACHQNVTFEKGIYRRDIPAVKAMQHPSKNRLSFSRTHGQALTSQGVRALRERTVGGFTGFQTVGDIDSTVVSARYGTNSLAGDEDAKEFARLAHKIAHDKRYRDAAREAFGDGP